MPEAVIDEAPAFPRGSRGYEERGGIGAARDGGERDDAPAQTGKFLRNDRLERGSVEVHRRLQKKSRPPLRVGRP